jgi:hypothetical protein
MRPPAVAAVVVLLGVAVGAVGASAYFTSKGTGSASANVGTLATPTISKATPGAGTVALTWSTVPPPGPGAVTYYVSRDGGAPGGTCPTSGSPTGVSTCTDSGLSAGTYHYTVTAKWQSWTATSTTTAVTLASGAATHLVLAASTTTPTAGAVDGLTITAKDASNNTVTAYTGDKSLTFTGAGNAPDGTHPTVTDKTPSAVNFGSAETITFAGGVASEATPGAGGQSVMKLYKAETASIVVSDGSVNNGAGLPVTVTPLAVSTLSLAATSPIAAGTTDNLTITALDTYGNTATSYSGSKGLTFAGPEAIGAHEPTVTNATGAAKKLGEATAVTFTAGVSSVIEGSKNGQMILYKAQTKNLTVTDGSHTNGAGLPVTVTPGTATTIAIVSGSGQSAPVSTAFASPLVALATDAFSNPVSGASVTFAAPSSLASGSFASCTSNPHTYECVATTNASGDATSSIFTANATAGSYNISAKAPTTNTVNFTFTNSSALTITSVLRSGGNKKVKFTGAGAVATATITVTICAVNSFPCASPIATSVAENPTAGNWESAQDQSANLNDNTNYFAQAVQGSATSAAFSFTVTGL